MPPRKNKKTRTYKKRALKPNARKATTVGAVKNVVKKVLNSVAETKEQVWAWSIQPTCLQTGTSTLSGNYMVLNPSNATHGAYTILRGDDPGEMTGDRIRVKSAKLQYVITPNDFNATTNVQPRPFYLRAYIYKYKKQPQNDPQVVNVCGNVATSNFFELGTTEIGFTGTLEDMNLKMNKQSYTYYTSKTWKIGQSTPQAGTNNTIGNYQFANNDFKLSAFGTWDVTKYLPKNLNRDDGGVWQDDYIVCMFQILSATGAGYTTNQSPCRVRMNIILEYTDM